MQYEVLYAIGYDTANNSMFCLTEANLIMYKITIVSILKPVNLGSQFGWFLSPMKISKTPTMICRTREMLMRLMRGM